MKKLFQIISMIFILVIGINAQSNEIKIGSIIADVGSNILIPIKIISDTDIAGINVRLVYDKDSLKYNNVVKGDILLDNQKFEAYSSEEGKINIVAYAPPGTNNFNSKEGIVFNVNFTVKPNGKNYEINFASTIVGNPSLPPSGLADKQGNSVPHSITGGKVIINPSTVQFRWGDLDGDGKDGTKDATLILQWKVGIIDRFPIDKSIIKPNFPPAGDLDGDGKLGTKDATLILQKKVGIITRYPVDKYDPVDYGPDNSPTGKIQRKNFKFISKMSLASYITGITEVNLGTNNEIEIPISIQDANSITGYFMSIQYDTSKLEYISTNQGTLTKLWPLPMVNQKLGLVAIVSSGIEGIYGNGSICVLRFKVLNLENKSVDISFADFELNDEQFPVEQISVKIRNNTEIQYWSIY